MKKLLLGLLLLLVLLAGIGFVLPTDYHVAERVTIKAPLDKIHALVGDLKAWEKWAPWYEADPSIVTTYGEVTRGVGASQTWTSKEGDGELTLTRCDPDTGIAYDMAFIMDGQRAPAKCEMNYAQKDGGTEVVWTMEGDVADYMPPIVGGYMNLFLKMAIGGMFQQGLEKLKLQAEA